MIIPIPLLATMVVVAQDLKIQS